MGSVSYLAIGFLLLLVASCGRLFSDPRTVARQAPLSMKFSRQEYWNGLPFPSPGDVPDPGIEPRSPTLQADALTSEPPGKPNLLESSIFLKINYKQVEFIPGMQR